MPLVNEVSAVLFEGKNTQEALIDLMSREGTTEHRELDWN